MSTTATPRPIPSAGGSRGRGFTRALLLLGALTVIDVEARVNALQNHASPYLALHADDPVAWRDWRPDLVAQARREGKLLYLSIGYFSCHWCHVMQRESYRNADIAAFLNRHFIPVKIDRELEPALDADMIGFVERTRGMAGWPLNVFVTPQGAPLFAMLYAEPKDFKSTLVRLQALWQRDQTKLVALAQKELPAGRGPGTPTLDAARVAAYAQAAVKAALGQADTLQGGFGEEGKFPSVPQLLFLLDAADDAQVREFLTLSLTQMAQLGLHDHLGGGFFRYTVDPAWRTPHFEKMLYDNAQLATLYLRTGARLKREDFTAIGLRTLDFMARDMRGEGGAMIASLSALDDKGVEGGYYLWDAATLARHLNADERRIAAFGFGMQDAPPFDAGWLPLRALPVSELARELKKPVPDTLRALDNVRAKLLAVRGKRKLPRDTKRLAAWNALALEAFTLGAQARPQAGYQRVARGIRDYLVDTAWDGKSLQRAVVRGKSAGSAALEDYAFTAQTLLGYAEFAQDAPARALARRLVDQAWKRFYGPHGWLPGGKQAVRIHDGEDAVADGSLAAPSGALIAASLALAKDDAALRQRALAALNSGHTLIAADPFWYVGHIAAMRAALTSQTRATATLTASPAPAGR